MAKILLSGLNPKKGGGITHIINGYLEYFRAKHEIRLAFPYSKGTLTKQIEGVKYTEFRKIPFTKRHNYSKGLKFDPGDHDIFQSIGGTALEALPFYLKRVPYFVWAATGLEEEKNAVGIKSSSTALKLERFILENAREVWTISEKSRKVLRDISGRDDIRLIYPHVSPEYFKTEKINNPQKAITFAGRMNDRRKNLPFLLDIFEDLEKEFEDLKLILAGQFPPFGETADRIDELGKDRVELIINPASLNDVFSRSSVFILPSLQEGFGIVLTEAMAASVPVIATKCGGPEDIITNGKNGFLIDIGDKEDALNKIRKLLNDDKLNHKIGQQAKASVLERFSGDTIFSKVNSLYEEFLNF